jgi:dihydroneopterin aldolase
MPDRIEIRGLRALGLIGVNPEERERPQPFEVDFDVELDTSKAGRSDHLDDTVDYGRLAVLAEQVVVNDPHLLLERVAERIAQVLLDADGRIDATTVTVRKLRPPIPADLTTSGVTITRYRG